ncbi:BQ2448_2152 [Microbotryum intermedium]|uniref:BQ2448_2152 protein n=1 Tax=Microbotryum intermedium TaxID=269621 RepID=A0A238F5E1_9BASI|nr:BQ2448_2152 [Microbotryum intermedium]
MAAALVAPMQQQLATYGARHAKFHTHTSQDVPDDLLFGNFCLNCGNEAPSHSPYCSEECRQHDSEHESAPDSPSVLPALVPSASKSTCSTPSSSATNSPSPRGMVADAVLNDDPPRLDLGAPVTMAKFYGGQSLPIAMRYPTSKSWKALHMGYPAAGTHDVDPKASPQQPPSDLNFRRRASKPQIPAPLFYRERAAHLAPTSDITSLALPPLSSMAASSAALPPPVRAKNCGRPGCVGEMRRPRISASGKSSNKSSTRAPSNNSPRSSATAALQSNGAYDSPSSIDILMSPRIRALRVAEMSHLASLDDLSQDSASQPVSSPPKPADEAASGSSSSDDDESSHTHSAFACYLFSHLLEDKKRALNLSREDHADDGDDEVDEQVPRGRTGASFTAPSERGVSVDSAAIANKKPARPTRFLFSRGTASPAPVEEELDHERTIRSRQITVRPKIEPGHFISATTDSPSTSVMPSSFPSTPSSPPTSGRGRSVTRRPSHSEMDVLGDLPAGRGRSQLRGPGAVLRSLSPTARGASESSSRGRRSSSSRARVSESRGRESRGRGRSSRNATDDEALELVDEGDEDERGRGRGRGRDRSSSALRSREIVISGAAYGHGSP